VEMISEIDCFFGQFERSGVNQMINTRKGVEIYFECGLSRDPVGYILR
jgi:hypothetical protein